MENLLLTRIDDRLIHGQVMTAWMKNYPAKQILIVDNQVAKDEFMLFVLQNAAPSGIRVIAHTEVDALAMLEKGLDKKTLILAKTPLNLKSIVDGGIKIPSMIIGGMGLKAERKPLYKNISATQEERDCIKHFISMGIDMAIHITPDQKRMDLKGIVG